MISRLFSLVMMCICMLESASIAQVERDPEDVKHEREYWKRTLGDRWGPDNDPSQQPKYIRALSPISDTRRKDEWYVTATYHIQDSDDCKSLAVDITTKYGGVVRYAALSDGEPLCFFYFHAGPAIAELLSQDPRIRRAQEVDDSFPPLGRQYTPSPFQSENPDIRPGATRLKPVGLFKIESNEKSNPFSMKR
jgi:hypothetical protein